MKLSVLETQSEALSYRPISMLAVGSLGGGVLSALALLSPMLWVVPLLCSGLACVALLESGREGGQKAGRLAALLGLALSIGFGSQAVSTTLTSHLLSGLRARTAAQFWFDTIGQGRLADARSMCVAEALAAVDFVVEQGVSAPIAVGWASPSDRPAGGWVVPVTVGSTVLRLTLESVAAFHRGRWSEQWMVAHLQESKPGQVSK
ncbi:MAG: hypothetical protein DWH98_01355 [Planctomycetota bacterium]|jgi:hypothetical protein|nr:MAG: hypothetical protein DWH98_01355 [Planctomycetota bacterium]